VLVDGIPLKQFGYANYREQVGAVLQDDHLFAGSIADNIALFDDASDLQRIANAAAASAIHDDIARMPMGYETLVGDMGSSLSGGQKQRVVLARALYREPRLLVMDEATSHLDGDAEQRIVALLDQFAITRIVIAHLSASIAASNKQFFVTGGQTRLVYPMADNTDIAMAPACSVLGGASND
jgi:ATP-binding cassette subfamily B protein RaxB